MTIDAVAQLFTANGGEYLTPPEEIAAKLAKIKIVIFDWDGVFNDGIKGEDRQTGFSEPDAMGLNMLRYGFFLNNQMLNYALLSGQYNSSSFQFAKREHISAVYMNVLNKVEALDHFARAFLVKPEEVMFVYDDLLDLSVARKAGLRICIRHKATPMFTDYIRRQHAADYITGCDGHQYGVRETTEMLLGLMGRFDEVCENRIGYTDSYQRFMSAKKMVQTQYFRKENTMIAQVDIRTGPDGRMR